MSKYQDWFDSLPEHRRAYCDAHGMHSELFEAFNAGRKVQREKDAALDIPRPLGIDRDEFNLVIKRYKEAIREQVDD